MRHVAAMAWTVFVASKAAGRCFRSGGGAVLVISEGLGNAGLRKLRAFRMSRKLIFLGNDLSRTVLDLPFAPLGSVSELFYSHLRAD